MSKAANKKLNNFRQEVAALIADKSTKVISVDFFDTLMFRSSENPVDLFEVVYEALLEKNLVKTHIGAQRFRDRRVVAEVRARSKRKNHEVSLDDIYAELDILMPEASAATAAAEEIKIEAASLRIIDSTVELLDLAKRQGKRIVITSDTYFSAVTLRDFMPKKVRALFEKIYVSSELGCGKGSGAYPVIIADLGVEPTAIAHFGDNYHADVEAATKNGIKAFLLPSGTSEMAMLREREFYVFSKRNAHCSMGRLSHYITHEKKVAALFPVQLPWSPYSYGAYVLGPIFYSLAVWMKSRLQAHGIQNVLCLMREGYLLRQLLEEITDKEFFFSSAYLSRKVLFKASLDKPTADDIAFAFANPMATSLSGSCDLINLSVAELSQLFGVNGPSGLLELEVSSITTKILGSRATLKKISTRAKALRQEVVRHVYNSLNDVSTKQIGLVDLGWNGTIQRLLDKCLKLEGVNLSLHGLYLMTTGAVCHFDDAEHCTTEGFLINGGHPAADFDVLLRNLEILEQACCPPHGSVASLENGLPTVDPSLLPAEQIRDISLIQAGIKAYVSLAKTNLKDIPLQDIDVRYLRAKLARAMLYPSETEAKIFANWAHDDNLFTGESKKLFSQNCIADAASATLAEIVQAPMSKIYWPAGAIALAPHGSEVGRYYVNSFFEAKTFNPWERALAGGFSVYGSDGQLISNVAEIKVNYSLICRQSIAIPVDQKYIDLTNFEGVKGINLMRVQVRHGKVPVRTLAIPKFLMVDVDMEAEQTVGELVAISDDCRLRFSMPDTDVKKDEKFEVEITFGILPSYS